MGGWKLTAVFDPFLNYKVLLSSDTSIYRNCSTFVSYECNHYIRHPYKIHGEIRFDTFLRGYYLQFQHFSAIFQMPMKKNILYKLADLSKPVDKHKNSTGLRIKKNLISSHVTILYNSKQSWTWNFKSSLLASVESKLLYDLYIIQTDVYSLIFRS